MKMKQTMLWAAIVSLGLAACSKDDSAGQPGDTAPKSVTITLSNVTPEARGTGSAITDNTPVNLKNYYVFFSDGINLHKAKQANGTDDAVQFISNASGNLTQTFHFLPAEVNEVIVIGNVTEADYSSITTRADLDKVLALDDEQDHEDLTLYGTDNSLTLSTSAATDDPNHNLYTAEVNLLPRIARIEVEQFGCTFGDPATYSQFTLNKMALNCYYTQLKGLSNTVQGNLNHASVTDATVWPFLNGLTSGWHNDDLNITLTAQNGQTITDKSKYLIYHFFPSTQQPELVLGLTGTKGGVNEPLYLKTEGFLESGSPVASFQPGHIYKVNFTFDEESDLSNPQKCVKVTVTVAQWEVHPVTPDFGN